MNFVYEVMMDEDGKFGTNRIDMNDYGWIGGLLGKDDSYFLRKTQLFGNETYDLAEAMWQFLDHFRPNFEMQGDRQIKDEVWDTVAGNIYRIMEEFSDDDTDMIVVTAYAYNTPGGYETMNVTFLVSFDC